VPNPYIPASHRAITNTASTPEKFSGAGHAEKHCKRERAGAFLLSRMAWYIGGRLDDMSVIEFVGTKPGDGYAVHLFFMITPETYPLCE
jgi:hypothetical protein